jgi:hypothetical protein
LIISHVNATDTEITAEMTAASSGAETITVTTPYGTADIGVSLSGSLLTLSPGQLAVAPGTSGTLSATIDPPLAHSLTLNLKNSDPDVVAVPSTITIPVGGTVDFTVDGLEEGVATVSAGDPRSVVFVTAPITGDVVGLSSRSVSVYVDAPTSNPSSTLANPVSVYVNASSEIPASAVAKPVSVYVDAQADELSTTVSGPVSVEIQ